jgi:hypothetical protein
VGTRVKHWERPSRREGFATGLCVAAADSQMVGSVRRETSADSGLAPRRPQARSTKHVTSRSMPIVQQRNDHPREAAAGTVDLRSRASGRAPTPSPAPAIHSSTMPISLTFCASPALQARRVRRPRTSPVFSRRSVAPSACAAPARAVRVRFTPDEVTVPATVGECVAGSYAVAPGRPRAGTPLLAGREGWVCRADSILALVRVCVRRRCCGARKGGRVGELRDWRLRLVRD